MYTHATGRCALLCQALVDVPGRPVDREVSSVMLRMDNDDMISWINVTHSGKITDSILMNIS